MPHNNPVLGYLSAAPRVSSRPDAEASGPRAHVLGVINGFCSLGWEVRPFIVGDRLPRSWSGQGSERSISGGRVRTLTVDLLRLSIGALNSKRAWNELGDQVNWVYERFAVLQTLGDAFKRRGIPWILETNALYYREAAIDRNSLLLTGVAKRKEIGAYRSCDVLVCVSQALKDIIQQEANVPDNKIIIVPNGVDISFFDPVNYPRKPPGREITIGFVGHLYPWQGLEILLEAVRDIYLEDGIIYNIAIVGDGPNRKKLEHLASELNLSSQINFFGKVPWEEVPRYIAGFDLGYSNKLAGQSNVSYFSPLKLYEYLAMAKPVLCAEADGATEAIRNLETGFLFSAEDKCGLKKVLKQINSSREKLPVMGKQARRDAVTHHSWEHRVSFMCTEIQRILNETSTR